MSVLGNSYYTGTILANGHARKVWREIRGQYPSGGKIANLSDWVSVGKIPAGTPVKFDMTAKTVTAYTDAKVKSATDATTLGINGLLQEDIYFTDAKAVCTGTVVYDGEVYDYMINADTIAKIKSLASIPSIVFVH